MNGNAMRGNRADKTKQTTSGITLHMAMIKYVTALGANRIVRTWETVKPIGSPRYCHNLLIAMAGVSKFCA